MHVHVQTTNTLLQALLESHKPLWQNLLCSYLLGAAHISKVLSFYLLSLVLFSFLFFSFSFLLFFSPCDIIKSSLSWSFLWRPTSAFPVWDSGMHTPPSISALPISESKPGDSFSVLWLSVTSLLTRAEHPPAAHIFSPGSFWGLLSTHSQH